MITVGDNTKEVNRLLHQWESILCELLKKPVALKICTPVNIEEFEYSTGKPFFKHWIQDKFKDGIPKTRNELYQLYKQDYGQPIIPEKTFSSKLSSLLTDNSRIICKYVFKNNPIETRYYYGLFEWATGDILQDDYRKAIKKPSKEGRT